MVEVDETNGGGSVGEVIFDTSMSLDGFVTGSNARQEELNGDGGQRLTEWAFGDAERDREILAESEKSLRAVIAADRVPAKGFLPRSISTVLAAVPSPTQNDDAPRS